MRIDDLMLAAKRLRMERERLRFTIAELSAATGLGKSTIVNYESGQTSPTIEYLACLQTLSFDICFILHGTRHENIFTNEHPDLLWAAVTATEKLRNKKLAEEVSDTFLGMTTFKFFKLLLDQNEASTSPIAIKNNIVRLTKNETSE